MAYSLFFLAICFFFLLFLFTWLLGRKNSTCGPRNWPLLGMLLPLLQNIHRIHDWCTEVLNENHGTYLFKGPWFTNMDLLITVNPANVHYIMSKNCANFPKGSKYNEIFDVLGNGIFNVDSDLWMYHRRMAHSFFNHPRFHSFLVKTIKKKVEGALIPFLDHASDQARIIDLQDVFDRFTFDVICILTIGHDPMSLSIDMPRIPFSKALDDVEEVIFYRHALPKWVWKFQRWLGIGKEMKYRKAWEILDDFIYECISVKQREMKKKEFGTCLENEEVFDLLTSYMNENKDNGHNDNQKFLRDTILSIFIAGRDTTSTALSWFFYLLSENPKVEAIITKEMETINHGKDNMKGFYEESIKQIYLHGALCETLRLYPPVVFEAKSPLQPDILPSCHHVDPSMQIIFNLYAMGRMRTIWGSDCHKFKPERWITERGKAKHEPSYKFLAFNAGPRTCLGKDMAFTQMKAVASTIINNYHVRHVEGHTVVPAISIILHMRHGFKVNIIKKMSK